MKTIFALAAASLAMSGSAFAQDTAPAEAAPPAGTTAPAEAAPPAAAPQAAEITDDQVDRFALAALKVEQIAADANIEQTQKQTMMATAVQESGMDAQEFNTIAQASQADPALQERIQVAAAAHVQAAQGAAAPAEETGTP